VAGTAAAVEAAVDDHHRDAANLAPTNVVDRTKVIPQAVAAVAGAEVVAEAMAMEVAMVEEEEEMAMAAVAGAMAMGAAIAAVVMVMVAAATRQKKSAVEEIEIIKIAVVIMVATTVVVGVPVEVMVVAGIINVVGKRMLDRKRERGRESSEMVGDITHTAFCSRSFIELSNARRMDTC